MGISHAQGPSPSPAPVAPTPDSVNLENQGGMIRQADNGTFDNDTILNNFLAGLGTEKAEKTRNAYVPSGLWLIGSTINTPQGMGGGIYGAGGGTWVFGDVQSRSLETGVTTIAPLTAFDKTTPLIDIHGAHFAIERIALKGYHGTTQEIIDSDASDWVDVLIHINTREFEGGTIGPGKLHSSELGLYLGDVGIQCGRRYVEGVVDDHLGDQADQCDIGQLLAGRLGTVFEINNIQSVNHCFGSVVASDCDTVFDLRAGGTITVRGNIYVGDENADNNTVVLRTGDSDIPDTLISLNSNVVSTRGLVIDGSATTATGWIMEEALPSVGFTFEVGNLRFANNYASTDGFLQLMAGGHFYAASGTNIPANFVRRLDTGATTPVVTLENCVFDIGMTPLTQLVDADSTGELVVRLIGCVEHDDSGTDMVYNVELHFSGASIVATKAVGGGMTSAEVAAAYQPLDADLTDLGDGTLTGSKVSGAVVVSGGTVNNSVIGGVTPAAGTFTTVNATTSVTTIPVPYDATTWNGNNTVPTRDELRDKIETMGGVTQGDLDDFAENPTINGDFDSGNWKFAMSLDDLATPVFSGVALVDATAGPGNVTITADDNIVSFNIVGAAAGTGDAEFACEQILLINQGGAGRGLLALENGLYTDTNGYGFAGTVEAYDATGWDGDSASPTKNDVRDKFQTLVIGTNVQAFDADLTTWAGVTPGTGVATAAAIATNASGGLVTVKRSTAASTATLTPTGDATINRDTLTAQAAALAIDPPSGTALDGNSLIVKITDNGTSRALTWNAIFESGGVDLPAATTISKTLTVGFLYNFSQTKWQCVAVGEEP